MTHVDFTPMHESAGRNRPRSRALHVRKPPRTGRLRRACRRHAARRRRPARRRSPARRARTRVCIFTGSPVAPHRNAGRTAGRGPRWPRLRATRGIAGDRRGRRRGVPAADASRTRRLAACKSGGAERRVQRRCERPVGQRAPGPVAEPRSRRAVRALARGRRREMLARMSRSSVSRTGDAYGLPGALRSGTAESASCTRRSCTDERK